MPNAVDRVIDEAIAKNRIVGTEVTVWRDGAEIYSRAAGYFDREAGIAMPENAIYRLASVTKPIVAATALAMVDKGLLALSDLATDYLPYFTPSLPDGSRAPMTIHHLLTHTAGLAYDFPADPTITTGMADTDLGHEENLSRIASQKLLFAPGSGWSYSVALDVLGAILAQRHSGTLGEAVAAHVTGPLGLAETGFAVTDTSRLVLPYADGMPVPVRMGGDHVFVDDDGDSRRFSPARLFNPRAFQSGGAGMVSTTNDLMRFFETLRLGGGNIVKPDTVAMATHNRVGTVRQDEPGMSFGYLGAIVEDPVAAGTPQSPGSYEWGGVYGHSWLVDPAQRLIMLSMSNTALEGCTGAYPRLVRNAIYADLI